MKARVLVAAMTAVACCAPVAVAKPTPHLSMKTALTILHRVVAQQKVAPGGDWSYSGDDCFRTSARHIRCRYAMTDERAGYNCVYRLDVYRKLGSRHATWRDALQGGCYYFTGP